MKGKPEPRPYLHYNCEYCLRCLSFCPQNAVVSGIGWAALLWFLASSLAWGNTLFAQLAEWLPVIEPWHDWWTAELLNSIFYYPVIIAAYFLFFQLLRLMPLRRLFSFLSLNRHLPPYREPDTKLRDML